MRIFTKNFRNRLMVAGGATMAALRSVYPAWRNRAIQYTAALPGRAARYALTATRRAIRSYRTMRRTRRRMALGLAAFRSLSTMKYPAVTLRMYTGDCQTQVLRVCPLGSKASSSTMYMLPSLFKGDERFKALSDLYNEWRILNVTCQIKLLAGAKNSGGCYSIFGRVIRSCNKSMSPTNFFDGSGAVYTPGLVWKQPGDVNDILDMSLSVAPVSTKEKDTWYSTDCSADAYLNQSEWDSDRVFDFAPALDFAVVYSNAVEDTRDLQVSVFYRVTVQFRSANSDFGSEDSKVITLDSASQVNDLEDAIKTAKSGITTVSGNTTSALD